MAAKKRNRSKTAVAKRETVDTSLFEDFGSGCESVVHGASSIMWTAAGLTVATAITAVAFDQVAQVYKKHF